MKHKHKMVYQDYQLIETEFGPRQQQIFKCECGEEDVFLRYMSDGEPMIKEYYKEVKKDD